MSIFIAFIGTLAAISAKKENTNEYNLIMVILALGCYAIAAILRIKTGE